MNQSSKSKHSVFRFSIRSVLVLTAVVAAFFCGHRSSKEEIESLRKEAEVLQLEVARNRALADHAFSQLDELRIELQKPTVEHVMLGDANEWPEKLRRRLPMAPEQIDDQHSTFERLLIQGARENPFAP